MLYRKRIITAVLFLCVLISTLVPAYATDTAETHKHSIAGTKFSEYEVCDECKEQIWKCTVCTNLNSIELKQCPLCLEYRGPVTPEEKAAAHLVNKKQEKEAQRVQSLFYLISCLAIGIIFTMLGIIQEVKNKKNNVRTQFPALFIGIIGLISAAIVVVLDIILLGGTLF